ncbi:MAG: hypothetical protein KatS3mg102_0026 [Planctomycetota bacterium]|nr:MAG: hypothetical protein KatS3mg102_0026 [Planctomycetota bacterium]
MGLDLYEEFVRLVSELESAGVEYAVVGALALAIHGVPRATTDIDLLVQPEVLQAALEVARRCGFVVEADPIRFPDGMVVHRTNKFEGEDHLTLDFLLVDPNLLPAWESRFVVQTEDGPIRVISRDALIRMKAAAGRTRDLADIEALREQDR